LSIDVLPVGSKEVCVHSDDRGGGVAIRDKNGNWRLPQNQPETVTMADLRELLAICDLVDTFIREHEYMAPAGTYWDDDSILAKRPAVLERKSRQVLAELPETRLQCDAMESCVRRYRAEHPEWSTVTFETKDLTGIVGVPTEALSFSSK
jgi:hypothetical protein